MEPAGPTSGFDQAMTMNVLYVTGRLSNADFIEHELGKIAPHIRIDVSPACDDLLARVAIPGRYDAVLLDPVHPGDEDLRQIARIREQRLPLAIIVMTGPEDEDPPLQALQAGADDYIVKRPHFVVSMPWILQRVVERRRLASEVCARESSAPAGPALEDALRALEARLAQLEEKHQAERAELEALRQESDRQRAARRALEGALRAAEAREQKEAFTELAAAAVQAFSELLAPVSDCSSLLMECLGKDDPRRVCAMRLVEITRQAGELARHLLTLRTRQEALDLNLIVARMAGKLRSLAGESIKMVTILSQRLPRILAARPLAERLLTALVAFARDLLPAGGTITLETSQRAPEAALVPEQFVLLAVTASGHGMQPHAETAALDLFVAACGASLSTAGDAQTGITIDVFLPAEGQVAVP